MKIIAAVLAAFVMISASAVAVKADSSMDSKMSSTPMTMHGMMAPAVKGPVYACTTCKMYYTPKQAKMMKYMDPMGHKLKKMSKVPAGYKMGMASKSTMGGSMMKSDTMKSTM